MSIPVFRVLGRAGAVYRAVDALTRGPDLLIGPVALTGRESPSSIPLGGEMEFHTHKLGGGVRVFDLMGPQERPITIRGKLFGPRAVARARQLDRLRRAGEVLPITWGDMSRFAFISRFECEYEKAGFVLPYSLELTVVPGQSPPPRISPLRRLGNALSDALGLPALTPTLEFAQQAVSEAKALMPVVAAISPSLAGRVGGILGGADSALSGTLAVAEGRLSGAGTAVAGVCEDVQPPSAPATTK